MKKFSFKIVTLLALLAIMLVFTAPGFSQGSWSNDATVVTGFAGENQGRMIVFTCTVDSVDTLTSETFSLAKYDGYKELYSAFSLDQDTVHIGDTVMTSVLDSVRVTISEQSIEVPYAYIASSVLGSPKITTYIQGSYDESNWFDVDTLCTDLTGETLVKGTAQLFRYHVPYYRAVVYGIALCRSDAAFDFRFYSYWNLDQRDR